MTKKGYNILVVDDVPQLRDVLMFSFEEDGNQVFGAGSCEDAYAIMEKNPIDLVVTDLHMPEGSGIELLEKIGEGTKAKPCVFVLTAFNDVPLEELFSKGAQMVFAKPFSPEHLIQEAKQALGQGEATAEVRSLFPPKALKYRQLTTQNPKDDKDVVLGRGGIFIPMASVSKYKTGDYAEFTLNFSEGGLKELAFSGKIEWVRKETRANLLSGIGVRFVRVDSATQEQLHKTIQSNRVIAFIPLGDKV